MSIVPTGMSTPEEVRIVFAKRSERGTPRRRTPISARSLVPPLFSTISWAKRWRVRPISSAERSCLFSTTRIWGIILTHQSAGSLHPRNLLNLFGIRMGPITTFEGAVGQLVAGRASIGPARRGLAQLDAAHESPCPDQFASPETSYCWIGFSFPLLASFW